MKEIKTYTELQVWKKARELASLLYTLTKGFPDNEQFGVTSQIRRSAVSVPSNIAEGSGRNHAKESVQFFYIARGSLYELETQLYLSFDQKFINSAQLEHALEKVTECKKLLHGYIKYFKTF
ncbi:MAG: four helix bundle protein [Candidatus Edwardsbacteria bacterium]|nr:four helix bundle protein [Candidatus Edwardsbacteria bacterium]